MPRLRNRRRLTDAERDARRHADRERVEQAARALLTSDGWQRWIRVRATNGLSRYSLRNQWLIAIECHARGITPDLRRRLPRLPRPQPLRAQGRDRDQDPRPGRRQAARRRRRGDRREADLLPHRPGLRRLDDRPAPGVEPVPLTPPAQPIDGDSHRHLIAPLHDLGRRARLPRRDPRAPRRRARRLVRPQAQADRRRRRARQPPGPHAGPRARARARPRLRASTAASKAEVLVDCVTYVVCSSVGLDVGGESIPYIAGWGEDGALDAIREYAADDRRRSPGGSRTRSSDAATATPPSHSGRPDRRALRPRGRGCSPPQVSGEPAGHTACTRPWAGRRPASPARRGASSPTERSPP